MDGVISTSYGSTTPTLEAATIVFFGTLCVNTKTQNYFCEMRPE
jgi:hypothetical protein